MWPYWFDLYHVIKNCYITFMCIFPTTRMQPWVVIQWALCVKMMIEMALRQKKEQLV